MTPVLQVDTLSVTFSGSDFHLEPLSFSMDQGEIVSIVGESGSGKTTLARALARVNAQSAQVQGSVLIAGEDIYGLGKRELTHRRAREFSIAFQNSRELLNPLMRIGTQLDEVLCKKYAKKDRTERAKELLELVELDASVLGRYPHELSDGTIQRILIVTAIALYPKLVILDEPTSALDMHSKHKLIDLIQNINKKFGVSFLIVTHDFGLARETSSRMMIFYQGQLVETGSTADMLDTPLHPYTRGLINSSMDINPYRDIWGIRNVIDDSAVYTGGCRFYKRCHQRGDECKNTKPALKGHEQYGERRIACNRGGIVTVMEARDVCKRFGKKKVLNHVDLRIYSSEILSLVGVSGSGKSTLSGIIAGYLEADAGDLLFDGEKVDYGRLRKIKQGVQMIFQDPETAVNPEMTVADAVIEPVKLNFRDRDLEHEARALLSDVGLPADSTFLKRRIKTLSGGQKQRILVARALSMEPRLIIADEITSMLDASSKANLVRLLKGIQNRRGISILFVTHDLSCAMKISDRICQLRSDGTIIPIPDMDRFIKMNGIR